MRKVPSLKVICTQILQKNVPLIWDVGETPFVLIKNLLYDTTGPQLAALEDSSPHLIADTNEVWRSHCIRDLHGYRKKADSGALFDEPRSEDGTRELTWREVYAVEEEKQRLKLEALSAQLRDSSKSHSSGRRHIVVDETLPPPKRRKIGGGPPMPVKPKTLIEKAREESRRVTSIYTSSMASPATSSSASSSSAQSSGNRKPGKSLKLIRPFQQTTPAALLVPPLPARSQPTPSASSTARTATSMSPPPPTVTLTAQQVGSRDVSRASATSPPLPLPTVVVKAKPPLARPVHGLPARSSPAKQPPAEVSEIKKPPPPPTPPQSVVVKRPAPPSDRKGPSLFMPKPAIRAKK